MSEMRLSARVGIGSKTNVSGTKRKPFQRLVHPGAQKRKTALKSSGRSLQSSETFVSELSFRASTGVTAQGTVASPARLPQPFQVAPDAGDRRYRTGASKSNSPLFSRSLFARAACLRGGVALYSTGQKIGSCAQKIGFTSPLKKIKQHE